jgi:hypothetical protein
MSYLIMGVDLKAIYFQVCNCLSLAQSSSYRIIDDMSCLGVLTVNSYRWGAHLCLREPPLRSAADLRNPDLRSSAALRFSASANSARELEIGGFGAT